MDRAPLHLPPRRGFLRLLLRNVLLAAGFIAISLGIGAAGYHWLAGLSWLDATLNASMILTGMGPVNALTEPSAKVFAVFYSLFSGVAFLTAAAVIFGPVVYRFLHRFHIEQYSSAAEASRSQDAGSEKQ